MLENIPRIKAPSKEVFFKEYVYAQRPVILTDLFDDQPICSLSSLETARKLIGDMPVVVQEGHEEYFTRLLQSFRSGTSYTPVGTFRTTVNGYLELVEKDPNTRLVCAEVPESMIGKIEARYEVPIYCRDASGKPHDFKPMLWLGNAGNYTHMHYDGDYRHVMQYQLWGAKRTVLLPPSAAKKLGAIRNNSVMSPEGMTEEESDRFVEYCDGWQAVVRTGETLVIPAAMWHYFEYVDTSMALTMRFSRNEYTALLADNCHMDYHLQAIVARLADKDAIDANGRRAFEELKEVLLRPMENPIERGALMQKTYERIYGELCADTNIQGMIARPFINELSGMIRDVDIVTNKLYQGELRHRE